MSSLVTGGTEQEASAITLRASASTAPASPPHSVPAFATMDAVKRSEPGCACSPDSIAK